jgi:polyisoprenoid-binding protein YceI
VFHGAEESRTLLAGTQFRFAIDGSWQHSVLNCARPRGDSIHMNALTRARISAALLTFALVAIVSPPLPAQDASWKIDPLHSAAQFSVRHMMISTVRGEITGITGSVTYDPQHPSEASVQATLDCSTINTGVAKRDAQLKSADFFDVTRYPLMKFQSKRVEVAGSGKLKIVGDLTINASTNEVTLEVEGPTAPIRDPRGNEKIGLTASTQISRKTFGITWNEVMESGGVAVADQVSITLDLELIKNRKP